MKWIVLAATLMVTPAMAETARVFSGEHEDFTRLVVDLTGDTAWTVGRTAIGYGFGVQGGPQPEYDISDVWDRIPRTRLQGLRVDPADGTLQLSLACLCHVFPFEFQPGMIVLDIRDGPAPAGSAFEAPFSPSPTDVETAPEPAAAATDGYDWLTAIDPNASPTRTVESPIALDVTSPDLSPLRDALLLQISRGAAAGVVDMELPGKPNLPEIEGAQPLDQARVRVGELPGLAVIDGRTDPEDRASPDLVCLPDDMLAIADWGSNRPPLDLLAEARAGLYGEFDQLDMDVVRQTVRLHLYLGFGAEARQYADLVPPPRSEELEALASMARLIDGNEDPQTPFASMLGCDGAAALWAALAHDSLPASGPVATDAIVRSFQALPPHLRHHLGTKLADLLLDRDPESARMIRDAMERTANLPEATIELLDAKADLQAERPEDAIVHAEAAVAEGENGSEGLVALVEAHFQAGEAVSEDVPEELRALAREARGSPQATELQRALVLALALSGQIDEAFASADPQGDERRDLWRVVAERAEDSALLKHAILPDDEMTPQAEPDVAEAIASRLSGLGFPDAALAWLGPVSLSDTDNRRKLAATAELARGDARQALTLLTGLDDEDAALLRAKAQTDLGALDAAQMTLEDAGKAEEAARIAAWEADWGTLQETGAEPWSAAATYAAPLPAQDAGALARGAAALDGSAATRDAISSLLATVPPENP